MDRDNVALDSEEFPKLSPKYKHYESYPFFDVVKKTSSVYGKTKEFPERPGNDIGVLRQIFLDRLQSWSLKMPKKYLVFPDEIRQLLKLFDVLQIIKFIMSYVSFEVCTEAYDESPILKLIGHFRIGFNN